MKIVVLDFMKGDVDILEISYTATNEEIEEYLIERYSSLDNIMFMCSDNLHINII